MDRRKDTLHYFFFWVRNSGQSYTGWLRWKDKKRKLLWLSFVRLVSFVTPCIRVSVVKWIYSKLPLQRCKSFSSAVLVNINALTTETRRRGVARWSKFSIKNTVPPARIFSSQVYIFEARQRPPLKCSSGKDILPASWESLINLWPLCRQLW